MYLHVLTIVGTILVGGRLRIAPDHRFTGPLDQSLPPYIESLSERHKRHVQDVWNILKVVHILSAIRVHVHDVFLKGSLVLIMQLELSRSIEGEDGKLKTRSAHGQL